jgi:hypothetical protein
MRPSTYVSQALTPDTVTPAKASVSRMLDFEMRRGRPRARPPCRRARWRPFRAAAIRSPRRTRDLLNTLATIAAKGAGFRSLHDTWTDTATAHGRLMLTVLGGLAEFERELISARTGEGRERAVGNGVRLGRKPTLTHHQKQEAIKRLKVGKETQREIARSYNVSRWTISRLQA